VLGSGNSFKIGLWVYNGGGLGLWCKLWTRLLEPDLCDIEIARTKNVDYKNARADFVNLLKIFLKD
jgi:hypothetical protein